MHLVEASPPPPFLCLYWGRYDTQPPPCGGNLYGGGVAGTALISNAVSFFSRSPLSLSHTHTNTHTGSRHTWRHSLSFKSFHSTHPILFKPHPSPLPPRTLKPLSTNRPRSRPPHPPTLLAHCLLRPDTMPNDSCISVFSEGWRSAELAHRGTPEIR